MSALPGVSGSERPTPAVRPFHGQRDRGQREWPRDPDPGAGIRRPQIRGASDPHLWPFASERHLTSTWTPREYPSTELEMQAAWELLPPDGILTGDDYDKFWPAVRNLSTSSSRTTRKRSSPQRPPHLSGGNDEPGRPTARKNHLSLAFRIPN